MQYISVYDSYAPEILYKYFSHRVDRANISGNGIRTICKINNIELTEKGFIKILTEYVWEILLPRVVTNYLIKNEKLSSEDSEEIMNRTMHIAFGLRASGDIVYEKLREFFNPATRIIVIDGFLRFRLKSLCLDMEALAKLCYDESCAQQEYSDFTNLIKEVVENQTPVYDEIYLVEEDEQVKILSCSGNDITDECIESYVCDTKDRNITYYDCVISSIISIAPRKIFIHCTDEMFSSPFIETLRSIFSGRIVMY